MTDQIITLPQSGLVLTKRPSPRANYYAARLHCGAKVGLETGCLYYDAYLGDSVKQFLSRDEAITFLDNQVLALRADLVPPDGDIARAALALAEAAGGKDPMTSLALWLCRYCSGTPTAHRTLFRHDVECPWNNWHEAVKAAKKEKP